MTKSTIALCYGTRPQVIKASILRGVLARECSVVCVDTGQHYDYAMNLLLYQQLEVAPPDHFLEVGSGTHASQTASVLERGEALLAGLKPRAVVVIGDTNSTLGCTLAAAKLRIPVVHVEAGLRARDALMAEEINRRAVDAVAHLLCTPCKRCTTLMRAEHPDATVLETGDVAYDVLRAALPRVPDLRTIFDGIQTSTYLFATLHRAELTDNEEHLFDVLTALAELDLPVLFAVHPRTQAVLDRTARGRSFGARLHLLPALGYLQSLALTQGAAAVVTDSGGVQREAYWLGVPCLTIRDETEWVETLEVGANRLVRASEALQELGLAAKRALADGARTKPWDRSAFGTGDAARRVASGLTAWLETRE